MKLVYMLLAFGLVVFLLCFLMPFITLILMTNMVYHKGYIKFSDSSGEGDSKFSVKEIISIFNNKKMKNEKDKSHEI